MTLDVDTQALRAVGDISNAVSSGDIEQIRRCITRETQVIIRGQDSLSGYGDPAEYLARQRPSSAFHSVQAGGHQLIVVTPTGDGTLAVIAEINVAENGSVRRIVLDQPGGCAAAGIADSPAVEQLEQDDIVLTDGLVVGQYRTSKRVVKQWGQERWLSRLDSPFTFKIIKIRAGARTSLQYHREKSETYFILTGTARLHYRHSVDGPTQSMLFPSGAIAHVQPGQVHRVEALSDVVLIEASTFDDASDNVRLEDDYGRGDGRIEVEHHRTG